MADPAELVFGKRTAILLVFAAQGVVVAALLLAARRNRAANRFLAALLAHLSLSLTPDIIGFAGFYDRWPWLSFAPFDVVTLTGPLCWGYAATLLAGRPPAGWRRHFVLPAAEFAYLLACFALPFELKDAWAGGGHRAVVMPLLATARLVSLAHYLLRSVRAYRDYQRWLAGHVSFQAELRLPWLTAFLGALGLLLALTVGFYATDAFLLPLGYLGFFWLHLGLALITYALGLAGWRQAERVYPTPADAPAPTGAPDGPADAAAAAEVARPARDWAALGTAYEARVREAEWWREPELTLADLAERLAAPEGQVSRALNLGLGVNVNEFVNRMRVAAVQAALRDPADRRTLLEIAFACGFSSKASFNRVFKARTGETPTAFRARHGS